MPAVWLDSSVRRAPSWMNCWSSSSLCSAGACDRPLKNFMATGCFQMVCSARYTTAKPPSPTRCSMRYFSATSSPEMLRGSSAVILGSSERAGIISAGWAVRSMISRSGSATSASGSEPAAPAPEREPDGGGQGRPSGAHAALLRPGAAGASASLPPRRLAVPDQPGCHTVVAGLSRAHAVVRRIGTVLAPAPLFSSAFAVLGYVRRGGRGIAAGQRRGCGAVFRRGHQGTATGRWAAVLPICAGQLLEATKGIEAQAAPAIGLADD